MKKLLLILLCLPFMGYGQGWETTFGDTTYDYGRSVQQTTDGGYVITGTISGDVCLIKTDGSGNELWTKKFGGISNDGGQSVQQTTDGGYIITGTISGDVCLIKTDGSGNELWTKTFGGTDFDCGYSVQQTTDGGYIITGQKDFEDLNETGMVYLIKTDGSGNELWAKTFGGTDADKGYCVQQTTDGGYIIAGVYNESWGSVDSDVYLIKTDGSGNEQWTKTFGGSDKDGGYSVQQTTDGGYIITGRTRSFGNGDDVYLIKTDGSGNEQWTKTFGDSAGGRSVQQTTDGGYIITGFIYNSHPPFHVYLIKTDGSGNEIWTKIFGGTSTDKAVSGDCVQQTTDGGYITVGYTDSIGNGNTDVYLIKTDINGNATSTFNLLINPNRNLEKTVDILGKETKPQTNTPLIEIYDDGSTEKKIIID